MLEAYGIVTKDNPQKDALRPRQCPNCNEPNKPDSKFCAKCRMVLTYDAYSETLEKEHDKDSEVKLLKEKYENDMKAMRDELKQEMRSQISQLIIKIKTRDNPTRFIIRSKCCTVRQLVLFVNYRIFRKLSALN